MEALLERGAEMENWNDARLDELSQTMKEGFAKVDKRFEQVDKRFEKMDRRFEQVDQRFEQVDRRFIRLEGQIKEGFERLDDRIFKVMLLMLVFCGGLLTTLVAALLGVGGS
jgi:predicted transcriptional regulator